MTSKVIMDAHRPTAACSGCRELFADEVSMWADVDDGQYVGVGFIGRLRRALAAWAGPGSTMRHGDDFDGVTTDDDRAFQ